MSVSSAAASRPMPGARQLLLLLVGCVMFSPLAIDIYLPSLPAMAREFAQPSDVMQMTVTLFLGAVGVGQILVGPLTDLYGRRPALLGGATVYLVGALVGALAQDISMLYFGRILQGLGACATVTVAFAAVRDCYTPEQGAKMYSYLNGALCIIPALAPVIGGLLAVQFGWRSNFLFMGGFALCVGLAAWRLFAETRPQSTVVVRPLYNWARYRPVLTSWRFVYQALVAMAAMSAILLYVSSSSELLVEQLGHSELEFSALFGGNAVINIITFFFAPRVISRLGRQPTVRLGLAIILLSGLMQGAALAWLPLSAAAFMVPVGVLSVGFSLALGAASSLALEAFGERAGTAAALLGSIQLGGSAIVTTVLLSTPLAPQEGLFLISVVMVLPLLLLGARHQPGVPRT
ncbi:MULTISPECIES: multidrug effflux MFS transporter [Cobetia]|uniref:multidrug effflux MFS transporter n=1 Tax=Cobetia TaxID=204286 RepID=UPI00200B2924|nr:MULTISPECIES: multidrug effflux MFS transporter [Cobetia]